MIEAHPLQTRGGGADNANMKKTILAAVLLLVAIPLAATAQRPDTTLDTTRHQNGVTYEGYYDSEFRLSDPLASAHASGADQISRVDTHHKFQPRDYTGGKPFLHRKGKPEAAKAAKHKA